MGKVAEKPEIKFDQKSLAALKPDIRTRSFSDPATPGLWLRITKAGAKTWFYVYRLGGRASKLHWLKVGSFAALPLIRARELARAYRAQVDAGVDPAVALAAAANRGTTVAEAAQKFMSEYAPSKLRPNSINGYRGSINKHIVPGLGKIPIRDLDRDQVSTWHRARAKEKVGANRALAVLSSICTQAEVWKMRPDGTNPCRHVDRFPEAPRVRDVTVLELRKIGKAIHRLKDQHSQWSLAAIQIVGLCSGRVSEVLSLRRDRDVRLEQGYALIQDHKASKKIGAKHLELPPPAVAILRGLPREAGNPYFFPGRKAGQPLTREGLHKVWLAVCEEAGISDLHLHDFRSFAASEGLAMGVDTQVTSRILGHGDRRTTEKHYTKVRDRQAAAAAAKISSPIAQAFGLEPKPKPNAKRLISRAIKRVKG